MDKVAFLGCSRGLGAAVFDQYQIDYPHSRAWGFARRPNPQGPMGPGPESLVLQESFDFSAPESLNPLVETLVDGQVERLFYFAGGGPHGPFLDKEWKDHRWALQVTLLTPMWILHQLKSRCPSLIQAIFVGSALADSRPEALGASYCAAKYGLRGWVESLQEGSGTLDIRLFRPGYMDTALLPKNAEPRQLGENLLDVRVLAPTFLNWAVDPKGASILTLSHR